MKVVRMMAAFMLSLFVGITLFVLLIKWCVFPMRVLW
jgi:hypothetical protein